MILFPLILGATLTPQAVLARMNGFLKSHSAVSATFTFNRGGTTGIGTVTLRFPSSASPEVDWVYEEAGQRLRFVSANSFGLDINYTHSSYDRGIVGPVPTPSGNIFKLAGYPNVLVGRGIDPAAFQRATGSVKPVPGADRLTFSQAKGPSTVVVELDVDAQGRLLRMHSFEPPDSGALFTFTDYKVDAAAAPSAFDVEPPIGNVPYSFDESFAPLRQGSRLPSIPFGGGPGTTLAVLAKTRGLLAFVDDPLPSGLLESLKRINSSVPVTLITLGSTRPSGFTTYTATEPDFDHAGIQATPQFYLVANGTLIQAWLGFRKDRAETFESEIKTSLSSAR